MFALADDSAEQIATYVELGLILVAREGEAIIGHAQIVDTELKSLAVAEDRQRSGTGRALVEAVIARARADGVACLIVSTATADIGNLRFYQRIGFRMTRIVRDAFGPGTGYPAGLTIGGIPLRDQVFLEFDLKA